MSDCAWVCAFAPPPLVQLAVAAAQEALNNLKKLPENRRCANCNGESQFGHGNVVVKFKSFVCSDCKSAHQAYSHRVKVRTGRRDVDVGVLGHGVASLSAPCLAMHIGT